MIGEVLALDAKNKSKNKPLTRSEAKDAIRVPHEFDWGNGILEMGSKSGRAKAFVLRPRPERHLSFH